MSGTLRHSPAHIVRNLLISLGGGTPPSAGNAWPMFINNEPALPDECITVYDTNLVHQSRDMRGGEVSEVYGIQVRLRASESALGFNKISSLMQMLDTQILNSQIVIPEAVSVGVTVPSETYLVKNFSRSIRAGVGSLYYLYLGKERKQTVGSDIVPASNRDIFSVRGRVAIRIVS